MQKTRMGVRLKEQLYVSTPKRERADEVKVLKEKSDAFLKKLTTLTQALNKHKDIMVMLDQSRSTIAESFTDLTTKTPLSAPANRYSYTQQTVSEKTKFKTKKFEDFAIKYVVEWQKVVKARIAAEMKETEKKRIEMEHYQQKVTSLQQTVEKTKAKEKPVPEATLEKLKRNQEKLDEAKVCYNHAVSDLCIIMEECTDRCWRDLHPLLLKCSEFEMSCAYDESNLLGNLKGVVTDLKNLATKQGISSQPRLQDIAEAKAEQISTKQEFESSDENEVGKAEDTDSDEGKNKNEEKDEDFTTPTKADAPDSKTNPFDD